MKGAASARNGGLRQTGMRTMPVVVREQGGEGEKRLQRYLQTQVMEVLLFTVGTLDFTQRNGSPQKVLSRGVVGSNKCF